LIAQTLTLNLFYLVFGDRETPGNLGPRSRHAHSTVLRLDQGKKDSLFLIQGQVYFRLSGHAIPSVDFE
jgi:hypothetical protein